MPANPRPACHWPSWNPDTNRDSGIQSERHQESQAVTGHVKRNLLRAADLLPTQRDLVIQTPNWSIKSAVLITARHSGHLIAASSCFLFFRTQPASCFPILLVLHLPLPGWALSQNNAALAREENHEDGQEDRWKCSWLGSVSQKRFTWIWSEVQFKRLFFLLHTQY